MLPRVTIVVLLGTTMPALCNPIKAIKSPIPAEILCFIPIGIASTISSRILKKVSKINIIPSKKTAVKANCHEYPIPRTMVNAKKALRPIPGARAKGSLA